MVNEATYFMCGEYKYSFQIGLFTYCQFETNAEVNAHVRIAKKVLFSSYLKVDLQRKLARVTSKFFKGRFPL